MDTLETVKNEHLRPLLVIQNNSKVLLEGFSDFGGFGGFSDIFDSFFELELSPTKPKRTTKRKRY